MTELKQNYTIVIVTHNMQQAARASDFTVFLTMDQDRAGYVVETRQHPRDLHQPQEPADRGLRVRPVRLRLEPTMTDNDPKSVTTQMDRALAEIAAAASDAGTPLRADVLHPTRKNYDRDVGEVKDNVLRMGAMVEAQIHAAIDALVTHDAEAALEVIVGDSQINEVQRKATAMIAATIATQQPVARDLRYLLTLDHVSYELERMGDHASSVAKQARKLAPHAPLKDYVELPRLGRAGRGPGPGDHPGPRRRGRGQGPRGRGPGRRRRRPVPRDLRRGAAADARGPDQRRARDADPVRLALPRADRRPGHEHRGGHRVPWPRARSRTSTHDHARHRRPGPHPRRVLGQQRALDPGEALFRHLGGDRDRRALRGHRAQGREPADAPRPRGGRAADRRARARSRSTTTWASSSTT